MERATLSPACWTASAPVGPRCIALLRRVRASGDAYTLIRNVDRDAVVKALAAGFVAWVLPQPRRCAADGEGCGISRSPGEGGMTTLSRQVLVEGVLTLWLQENRDTHSIAAELGIDEDEVCKIIEQSEGRRP